MHADHARPEVVDLYKSQSMSTLPHTIGSPGLGGNAPAASSHAAAAIADADEETRKLYSVIWNVLIPR
jgi:hypothetical protein